MRILALGKEAPNSTVDNFYRLSSDIYSQSVEGTVALSFDADSSRKGFFIGYGNGEGSKIRYNSQDYTETLRNVVFYQERTIPPNFIITPASPNRVFCIRPFYSFVDIDIDINPRIELVTNDFVTTTDGGVVYGKRNVSIRRVQVSLFCDVKKREEIERLVEEVGNVKPVGLDLYPDTPNFCEPMFCRISTNKLSWRLDNRNLRYSTSIEFTEVL